MAVHHVTVTMTGSAVRATATSTNVQFVIIESETGNADVKVGGVGVTSTDYGKIVEATAAKAVTITGTQANPINLNSMYFLGTNSQKIHLLYTA